MDEFIRWIYGKSAKNAHIREMAKKAIEILKKEGSMEYHELCKALGIGFDSYKKPKRTFYFVVNPLKKIQLIKEKRVYTDKEKKKYKTVYMLNPDACYGYMIRVLQEFYNSIK